MAKIKEADFYYGSVLSALFNNGITPSLIESGDDRQIYDITTNQTTTRLFVKYRSIAREGKAGYKSWSFVFSQDLSSMIEIIEKGFNLSIALICACEKLNESELAILYLDDIRKIFIEEKKDSITISRKKGERYFRISIGGGRDASYKIPSNRLDFQ